MKRALHLLKTWLDKHPRLRRRLVNVIYRLPALDMRLRNQLGQGVHIPAALDVDANHLPETARAVRQRLRARMSSQ